MINIWETLQNVEDFVVKQMENCNFSLQNFQHSVVVTELTTNN